MLAQLLEEVSVMSADRRRKEPRQVPRPWDKDEKPTQGGLTRSDNGGVKATGLEGMLAMAQMRGAVNLGG